MNTVSNNALGAFLRARRESLDPIRLGLPKVGRRRTPGLRREEIAQLANVSTTWYTWLEQGRDVKPSVATLLAITDALQCNRAETEHVFSLAQLTPPPAPQSTAYPMQKACQAMLNQLMPYPAYIQNARFDYLAWNSAFDRLYGFELAALDEFERNALYQVFYNPALRQRMHQPECHIPRLVGLFRSLMASHENDPAWIARLDSLTESAEFREYWDKYEIKSVENLHKQASHPELGEFHFQVLNWWTAPRNGDRMLVYMPADDMTAEKLVRLTSN